VYVFVLYQHDASLIAKLATKPLKAAATSTESLGLSRPNLPGMIQ
jgi:hypothetical protein